MFLDGCKNQSPTDPTPTAGPSYNIYQHNPKKDIPTLQPDTQRLPLLNLPSRSRYVAPAPGDTYVETAIDGLCKPDVLLVFGLAGPPVLLGNAAGVGVDTGLACLHVAENFDGVQGAALVRVNPVVSCSGEDKRGVNMRFWRSRAKSIVDLTVLLGLGERDRREGGRDGGSYRSSTRDGKA